MSDDRASGKIQEEIVSLRSRLLQLEHEIRGTGEKTDEQTTSMLIEQEELRREVVSIEQRMAQIEERTREIVEHLKKLRAWQGKKGGEDEQISGGRHPGSFVRDGGPGGLIRRRRGGCNQRHGRCNTA